MSEERTTLEIIAPSVDEAISKGVEQFGVTPDEVEIEILDEGSKGLFGLGGRQSRVRLTLLVDAVSTKDVKKDFKQEYTPAPEKAEIEPEAGGEDETLQVAETVVRELLDRMMITARVEVDYVEPEDSKDERIIHVDIQGNDLSILIGRKSETLNSMQYITGLIVSRQLGYWVPLIIDVQGYRERRERQLRSLARKMAEQAINTGRRQYLEPMSASERRMIHLELRDNELIGTESVGEEPSRKVTIFLKK